MALPGLSGRSSAFGIMLIVMALVSYGIALNVVRPLQQRNGAVPVMWRALGVALVLTAPLGLPAVVERALDAPAGDRLLLLGAGGTAIAHGADRHRRRPHGRDRRRSRRSSFPVVALILGVRVRHERVTRCR